MADTASSHLVLARKWRPERFGELVGQEHVTRTLAEALKRGRIAHAFLFTGIRGVGKTTAARILARCLNCEKGPIPEPCGECVACVEIRAGRALDVSEIDGATYRKIDDARAIIENLSYRPARDRFKIYIIDEAHQLTDQAFNALLKTLEEPPAHVKFILATTEPQKMPETILSRLQRYDFRRIALQVIFARMKELASREGIAAEETALMLLAREAGGSMRDAERMLETALASASGEQVTEAEVAANLGVASRSVVYEVCNAILDKDAGGALRRVRELHSRGANLEALGRDLLEALRNLAVAKIPSTDPLTPLADLPDHEAGELKKMAARVSSRDVMRLFKLMAETQEEILRSPYPDLLMEMAVIRMATLAPVMDVDELLRAIGNGGNGASSAGTPSPGGRGPAAGGAAGSSGTAVSSAANSSLSPEVGGARRIKVEGEVKADAPVRSPAAAASGFNRASPSPRNAAASNPPAPSPATIDDLPELRGFIRSRRAALAGFMEQGAGLTMEGDLLTVSARNDIYVRYLSDNRATIAELASEFFGGPIRVELLSGAEVVRAAPPRGVAAASESTSSQNGASNGAPREIEQIDRTAAAPSAPRGTARPFPAAMTKLPPAAAAETPSLAPAAGEAVSAVRPGGPEERQAILRDPEMRQIFDTLEARLVEVRIKNQDPTPEKG